MSQWRMKRLDGGAGKGKVLGALIAALGGVGFVWGNAGGLPGPWPTVLRALAGAALVWTLWRLSRPGTLPSGTRPDARSWRTYQISVGLMLLAFPLGARLLSLAERPELTVLWVVLVVGAHFYPFAGAFGAPVFRAVATALVLTALLGLGLTLAGLNWAPAAAAVAAGFVLLAFSGGAGQRRDQRTGQRT